MIFDYDVPERDRQRRRMADAYRMDEASAVETLLDYADFPSDARDRISEKAAALVRAVRALPREGGVEAFMQEYELSSHEGIVLMCLAEALLRVPDADTIDRLIEDKITSADWSRHLGHSESLFVNASTWGFMLTGSLLASKDKSEADFLTTLTSLLARTGEPVIRQAVRQAMRILGRQFIMGETIEDGLRRARAYEKAGYRFSFDMLGEAARTVADADKFHAAYEHAIAALKAAGRGHPIDGPGLSVKLSALDPRYEYAQYQRTMGRVLPRLKTLAVQAKEANIGFTIDAEEADRLDLSFDLIAELVADPDLAGWDGLGLALQAYQKRAFYGIDWLAELARRHKRRLMVRLVKGAYWDTEIKRSQENGLDGYPVFTRKASTDLAYIACARKLMENRDAFYPQFATHNAHTVAVVLELAGNDRDFEFQRLHGMGEPLYAQIVGPDRLGAHCRVYAPCGGHKELLPYLVRRLLENGANTSFVNRIMDDEVPIERISADPVAEVRSFSVKPHPRIPAPRGIFGAERPNSRGIDISDEPKLAALAERMRRYATGDWSAGPIVVGRESSSGGVAVFDPADRRRQVGFVREADKDDVEAALAAAEAAARAWRDRPVAERAACLERAADLYERDMVQLMTVAVREAGKTLPDAIAEVREAIDFCRYYSMQARRQLDGVRPLAGRSGEMFRWRGRGVFLCISPWNFPLAIFTGQITAALVTGNSVIAKPAEQTPIMAAHAVRLLHEAGVPKEVLHLLPGRGETVGAKLVSDPRIRGVAFTGGTDTAAAIRRGLAARGDGPLPFIAETGGLNAMIVDSTALPEQAVVDIVRSAFVSAGQRCSALRVLFVQEDVADGVIDMLAGAMSELRVGDPAYLRTDVGPVIDDEAQAVLEAHDARMAQEGRLIQACTLDAESEHGTFFAPRAYQIESIAQLEREVFGPFLHVVRYNARELGRVVEAINATGYGLTFGLHSRIDSAAEELRGRIHAGNMYVNRNIVGAVVGVQPFGGEGLSGTGPKAGGPHYLRRFSRAVREQLRPAAAIGGAPSGARWTSAPLIGGRLTAGAMVMTHPRAHPEAINGTLVLAGAEHVEQALGLAGAAQAAWNALPAEDRARRLEAFARNLRDEPSEFEDLSMDAVGIDRPAAAQDIEATVELVRGYAEEARASAGSPIKLRGYTGERNELALRGRGIFLCLTIEGATFAATAGMTAAALAAGNTVLLVGDLVTSHLAARLADRLHKAGVPEEVLQVLSLADDGLRNELLGDQRVAGIAFAGSHKIACEIDGRLAERQGPIVPLIVDRTDIADEAGFANTFDLYRYAAEQALSVDTTASGGNASLFSMGDADG